MTVSERLFVWVSGISLLLWCFWLTLLAGFLVEQRFAEALHPERIREFQIYLTLRDFCRAMPFDINKAVTMPGTTALLLLSFLVTSCGIYLAWKARRSKQLGKLALLLGAVGISALPLVLFTLFQITFRGFHPSGF